MEWYFAAMAGLQVLGGFHRSRMLKQQARIAELGGQISLEDAEFQARMARKAGGEKAAFIRRDSQRGVAAAVVEVGISGVELSGSPLVAIGDQIWQDERAAGIVMTNAQAAAASIELRGRAAEATGQVAASQLRAEAGFAVTVGWLNAFATGVQADTISRARTGEGIFG